MYSAILIAHLVIAVTLIGLVLIQHGKGADAGAAFGSGASATVFGARGSTSFLGKITALFAVGFFGTSLVLTMLAGSYRQPHSIIDREASQDEVPAQGQEQGPPPPAEPASEPPPGPAPDTESAPVPPPPNSP